MRAGSLKLRVTFQRQTYGKDGFGGTVENCADVCTVFASMRNLSGDEKRLTEHGGEAAVARTEFTVRYRSDIDEGMRVLYKGKVYNIRHVNNYNEENEKLIVTCDTGQSEAP